ncbi:MAG: FAD-dependent oxidoreductase, partial [Candidatus Competibacteraceae bacterium]|nr:FAD-dependent oxidoreductase [Candidatus Competibacteraceae bacterium]
MNDPHYDVIVIGTGPGGEGAAMKAAKEGQSVAVIEKHHLVGGGCTHWGTIPSKALRHAINRMLEFNTSATFRSALGHALKLSYPELLRSAESVIARQTAMRRDFYERNRVTLYHGHAKFLDAHTLEVRAGNQGEPAVLAADGFVIASGSHPFRPR